MTIRPLAHRNAAIRCYARRAMQLAFFLVALCGLCVSVTLAHGTKHSQARTQRNTQLAEVSVPDIELIDHNGQSVLFYSDLVKDHVVNVSFIFTSCTTVCSPIGANVAKLQKLLEKDPPNDRFRLISVSIDPVTDTPQRLRVWSDRFGRGPGWTLVTGAKHNVDHLLKSLNVFAPNVEDHAPIILLGSDKRDEWRLVSGFTAPNELAAIMRELSNE